MEEYKCKCKMGKRSLKYGRIQEIIIESYRTAGNLLITLYFLFACKSKIFRISFFLAIVSYRKDKVYLNVGKCINHIN